MADKYDENDVIDTTPGSLPLIPCDNADHEDAWGGKLFADRKRWFAFGGLQLANKLALDYMLTNGQFSEKRQYQSYTLMRQHHEEYCHCFTKLTETVNIHYDTLRVNYKLLKLFYNAISCCNCHGRI